MRGQKTIPLLIVFLACARKCNSVAGLVRFYSIISFSAASAGEEIISDSVA